ncbi:MAG: GNAT family N-acetyltransferase, partial [Bacteroidales bacterium]|nr:GNAT family N-acetyltransferase [Bacteroidales bacterium]
MEKIIDAVPTEDIIKELTEERFVRKTNFGHNEIYIVNAHNAPNTMREIGRLREWAFRESGGGTGKSIDIDEFDTRDEAYFEQLIVWDPKEKEILGGYRFINCDKLKKKNNGQVDTPTSELFYYSDEFIDNYLPYTIELGRSFIQ